MVSMFRVFLSRKAAKTLFQHRALAVELREIDPALVLLRVVALEAMLLQNRPQLLLKLAAWSRPNREADKTARHPNDHHGPRPGRHRKATELALSKALHPQATKLLRFVFGTITAAQIQRLAPG